MYMDRSIKRIEHLFPRQNDGAEKRRQPLGVACRLADDQTSYRMAFRLLYDAYLRNGLSRPNRLRLRILPHHLLDTSTVLLAEQAGRSLGTLSVIEDGTLGVPVELLYPLEVARLRRGGGRLAELTCLAAAELAHRGHRSVLRKLLKTAFDVAGDRHVDILTVCIHPRHAKFYRDGLGFASLGPPRRCPWVCEQPAVAMYRPLRCLASSARISTDSQAVLIRFPAFQSNGSTGNFRDAFLPLLQEASPFPWFERRRAKAA